MARHHALTPLIDRRLIADDIVEVSLSRPDSFAFHAGQYVQVALPTLATHDPRGKSRVFSISSSPRNSETLSIAFRRTGSAFKDTLEHMPLGDPVRLSGPYGHVTLTHRSRRPRILLASGIGITPHMSMIRFAAEEGLTAPITLLYVVTSRSRAAYLPEIEGLAQTVASLSVQLRIGEASVKDLSRAHAHYPNALWYLSGSPSRMVPLLSALRSIGVRDDDVVIEEFVGY